MTDYFSNLHFNSFCELCEKLVLKRDHRKRYELLKAYLQHHRAKCGESNFHPLMRLLLPNLERERGPYGVKEITLARTYIRILCLPKEGVDAKKLLNFNAPQVVRSTDVIGDFAEVAYWILRSKCGKTTNMTIGEINECLDSVSEKHSFRDPRGVDDVLINLFRRTSAEEQKWLIRILLKDLRIGLSNKQIMHIFHPDSSEVYELSNSLMKVCTSLKDPSVRLHELEVTLFESFRPMLSERCDVSKINFAETLIIETKYDGERFQLHFSNNKFKYFSRNGYEYTSTYGADEYSGYLTSLIRKQLAPEVTNVILDGEMMGWHTQRECLVTKAWNVDVKKLKVGNIVQPFFIPFDILHYNGEVLTNKPLVDRKKILDQCFEDLPGSIAKAKFSTVSANEEILAALNTAIDNCEEGVILKKMDSVYKPNSRTSGWYKLKPEYTEGGLVDLDLLILGGYYGQGRQKGKVSHFMMGLAVPPEDGEHPTHFQSLCRVGSGYTLPEVDELRNRLAPSFIKYRTGNSPSALLLGKEKPDVWLPPEKSCILQIKATEVVSSNKYYNGSTLKFVRVQTIRYDKPWYDCLTVTRFEELKQAYQGKLTSGQLENQNKFPQRKKKYDIETLLKENNKNRNISSSSNVLDSKEFCVITGFKEKTKEETENLILENGGRTTKIPGPNTFCLIVGDINLRVKNLCRARKHVVAHFTWLHDCLEKGALLPWSPQTLLGTTLMGKAELDHRFDEYGDSFTEPTTELALKSILDKMKSEFTLDSPSMLRIDHLLFGGTSPHALFRGINAYFLQHDQSTKQFKVAETIFEFHGGQCDQIVSSSTDYIFVDPTMREENWENIPVDVEEDETSVFTTLIITSSWILDCIRAEERIPVTNYLINCEAADNITI